MLTVAMDWVLSNHNQLIRYRHYDYSIASRRIPRAPSTDGTSATIGAGVTQNGGRPQLFSESKLQCHFINGWIRKSIGVLKREQAALI